MRRRMMLPRQKLVLLGCLLALLGVLGAGCENPREHEAAREGLPEDIGHLEYNVYITRQLNPADVEDQGYYTGPEPKPGFALFGVWLTVCNPSDVVESPHWMSSSRFQIEDTQGNLFRPVPQGDENVFAYQPRPLKHGACIPEPGSLAAASPTNGALLVFELPLQALENRPLQLIIESPPIGPEQERDEGRVELDI
jgi:hypothetical protein